MTEKGLAVREESKTHILHQALAIRNRSYTNQVRLRGLTNNLEIETCVVRYAQRKRDRQVLFV